MPIFKKGDMLHPDNWGKATINFVTTNSTLNNNGQLVMGRGIARQVHNRYRGLSRILGMGISAGNKTQKIISYKNRPYLVITTMYGIIHPYGITVESKGHVGIFQVKEFFAEKANLEIIEFSTAALVTYATKNPDFLINLNYPGIGYGKLKKEDVTPILKSLPDNVRVWEYYG